MICTHRSRNVGHTIFWSLVRPPRATFETTEYRLTFLVHIHVHAGCGSKPVPETDEGVSLVTTERTTETATERTTETTTEKIVRLI